MSFTALELEQAIDTFCRAFGIDEVEVQRRFSQESEGVVVEIVRGSPDGFVFMVLDGDKQRIGVKSGRYRLTRIPDASEKLIGGEG